MDENNTVLTIDAPDADLLPTATLTALREGLIRAKIDAAVGLTEDRNHIQLTFGSNADVKSTPFDQMSKFEFDGGHFGMAIGDNKGYRGTGFAIISTAIDGQIARKVRVFPNTVTSVQDGRMKYFEQPLPGTSIADVAKFSQPGEITDFGDLYRVMSMAPSDTLSSHLLTDEEGKRASSRGGARGGWGLRSHPASGQTRESDGTEQASGR